ncbi:hypothetical protein TNIN_181381 [Trichonephila inaurata madagascariensis]|uniref:MATH domain-containing protein n=1 Tax=Trichonephila inaurata madagascariensis TaxID=2747483 RepID=A0A8X6YR11_9ARAC|nr:hypothetical protein TNIN_181381 [Trichonephila inaurata madagascariensis]
MNLKREGYTFLWKIENFSSAWHRTGEKIESPIFTLDKIDRTQWRLLLYPKGENVANYIAYYLKRYEYSKGPKSIEINFEFSFLTEEGAVLQPSVALKDSFKNGEAKGTCQFKLREVFLPKCLPQDILTAYCRVWISGRINMGSVKMFANTIIKVEKLSFIWNIENFSKMGTSQTKVYGIKSALGDDMDGKRSEQSCFWQPSQLSSNYEHLTSAAPSGLFLDRADSNTSLPSLITESTRDMANLPTDMELNKGYDAKELFTPSIAPVSLHVSS